MRFHIFDTIENFEIFKIANFQILHFKRFESIQNLISDPLIVDKLMLDSSIVDVLIVHPAK